MRADFLAASCNAEQANGRQKAEVVRGPESLTGTRDSIAATVARLVLRCAWMWVAQETYSLALCSPEDAFEVRPLAGQKGLTCGVDTNAGAKDGQTLLMRMIFIIVSMHHAGIELDCNFQMCFSAGLDGCLVQERNDDRIAAQDLHELGFLTGIFDGHRGVMLRLVAILKGGWETAKRGKVSPASCEVVPVLSLRFDA